MDNKLRIRVFFNGCMHNTRDIFCDFISGYPGIQYVYPRGYMCKHLFTLFNTHIKWPFCNILQIINLYNNNIECFMQSSSRGHHDHQHKHAIIAKEL